MYGIARREEVNAQVFGNGDWVRLVGLSQAWLDVKALFLAGLFVTLGDMKAIVFYASLFPAFIAISALTLPDIAVILFVTVVTVGGVKLAYAFAATKVVTISKISKGLAVRNQARLASGTLIVGAGTYLIVKT
ncbi:LysE family transporter [Nitrosomonas aestuarii]|uniref:LysE family transporter n=1 Tax=Nitrosomonas aestuarii TaxID=52441 RepID=UPI000D32810D|nr:LysE type translocator [Nitrosomonas aestuarii]